MKAYFFVLISLLFFCIVENSALNHKLAKRQTSVATVCNSNECKYGSCEITSATTYQCHCNAGITGTNCNFQAPAGNPCSSNPCYNGGTCIATSASSYTCNCPPGIGGQQCTGTLNTCQCQNNGFCSQIILNNVNSYYCGCPSGYAGYLCQYQISQFQSCQVSGCQNGGTCTILSVCVCPPNYSGSLCQYSSTSLTTTATTTTGTGPTLTLCTPGICLNGGTCFQITYNLALCVCQIGFSGIYCNLVSGTSIAATTATVTTAVTIATTTTTNPNLQTCPVNIQNPCQNNGACYFNAQTNGISCLCQPTYTGAFCTTQIPFCSPSPCLNGGTCQLIDSINGICNCLPQYTGKICDQLIQG